MTGPKRATTHRSQRYYSWRGSRYWSVTTIIGGGVPKPALLPWGIKSVAEGAISRREVLASMTETCETPKDCAKGVFCQVCDEAVRWLKGVPYATRDKAAELGSYVHAAIDAYTLGQPFPKWPLTVAPRMKSFERFLAEYEPEYEASEASVFSKTHRYAGTLDAIVTIGGRKLLIDVKTGGRDIYAEVSLQLAAYRFAEFIGLPDGSEEPMRSVDGCAALHLPAEGFSFIDVQAGEREFKFFLHAKEVFRWQEDASKEVLRGPLRVGVDPGVQALGQLLIASEESA